MFSKILPGYCVPGRPLDSVDGVVLHYFSAKNVDPENAFDMHACRRLFMDLNRDRSLREWYMKDSRWPASRMYASAHVMIGRAGEVWRLVEFDQQAWHAGASVLNGRAQCNRWTLGIELIGSQHSGFTDHQYASLSELLARLEKDFGIHESDVAGHDTVRWAAIQGGSHSRPKYDPSGRKDGRGDNFDYELMRRLWENERQQHENGPAR